MRRPTRSKAAEDGPPRLRTGGRSGFFEKPALIETIRPTCGLLPRSLPWVQLSSKGDHFKRLKGRGGGACRPVGLGGRAQAVTG